MPTYAGDDHRGGGSLIVQTDKGEIQGFVQNGVAEFLGVPYAAPPVSTNPKATPCSPTNLRWCAPIAHAPWKGVLKTTAFGPRCAQITEDGIYAGPPNNNEDCLYLNIFTPAVAANSRHSHEKLPVMFWNHGGGMNDGESNDYDGSKLALQGRTVVVTVNFRLNLFGFLAHPALDHEGHPFANYQLLDNQFALKWLKQNVANFGGDPSNITIFGQSGGSKNVAAQVLSPLAKGLFNKAIFESGAVNPVELPLSLAEQKGTAFAVAAGCGSGTGPDVATCLRSLPAATVESFAGNGVVYVTSNDGIQNTGASSYVTGAIEDGQILPAPAIQQLETGNFNHVPMISGSVLDEGTFTLGYKEFYETPQAALTEDQFVASMNSTYGGNAGPSGSPPAYPAGTAAKVLAKYPLGNYASPELQWSAESTDGGTGCQAHHIDHILASQVPLYTYEFRDRTAPYYFPPMPGFVSLAYHTGDIQYYFPFFHGAAGTPHPLNAKQERLSDQLVAAWSNFAWTGNPNGQGNKPWPRYTGANGVFFTENIVPEGLSTETDAQFAAAHNCDFWDGILVYQSTVQ